MDTDNIRGQLWKKAAKEQSDYIEELKKMTPEQVIERSYETVMREDIFMTIENECSYSLLSDKQIRALLKLDYPLSACYDAWQKNDVTYMDRIQETIADFAKDLAEKDAQQRAKKKREPER